MAMVVVASRVMVSVNSDQSRESAVMLAAPMVCQVEFPRESVAVRTKPVLGLPPVILIRVV